MSRTFIIWLDSTLLLLFILLLSPRMTGLSLHEILGLTIFIPTVIHILLAWSWIRNSVRNLFKTTQRNKINFILNSILFTLMMIEVISGIGISQVALPFIDLTTINDKAWRALHNLTLNFTMLFVGLHIALNWDWIASAFRKRFSQTSQVLVHIAPGFSTAVSRTATIIIAVGIIAYAIYILLGPPTLNRIYEQDEIARFTPTAGHGIGQFTGEAFLIALVAYVARRWLRVGL